MTKENGEEDENERGKTFADFDFADLIDDQYKQFPENCIELTDSDEEKGNHLFTEFASKDSAVKRSMSVKKDEPPDLKSKKEKDIKKRSS